MARQVEDAADDRGGWFGRLVLVAALVAVGATVVRRRRERDLDDALWEDPRVV